MFDFLCLNGNTAEFNLETDDFEKEYKSLIKIQLIYNKLIYRKHNFNGGC